jgi:tetratricopeptide (TPR) repeat protein
LQKTDAGEWFSPRLARYLVRGLPSQEFEGVLDYRLSEIDVNTGGLERAAGHFASAVHFLQLGVDENPSDSWAWVELALALEQSGRRQDALVTWRRALARPPEDPILRQMATRAFRRYMGDPEAARSPF